jgi:hypothetical protein
MTSVFYIYDTATKQYLKKNNEHYDYTLDANGYAIGWVNLGLEYRPTIRGARVFKRLTDARAFLLNASGYYYRLPGVNNLPEWMGGPKKFDIPDTWELHEYDKDTKAKIQEIELMDTFKRSWKLRSLTTKYGPGVRTVFSELEKKNKLDQFSCIVSFTKENGADSYWWDDYTMTPAEQQEIADMVSCVDKKDIKLSKGNWQYAFAVKDLATGVQLRLSYSGTLKIELIDLTNLDDAVKSAPSMDEIAKRNKELDDLRSVYYNKIGVASNKLHNGVYSRDEFEAEVAKLREQYSHTE